MLQSLVCPLVQPPWIRELDANRVPLGGGRCGGCCNVCSEGKDWGVLCYWLCRG